MAKKKADECTKIMEENEKLKAIAEEFEVFRKNQTQVINEKISLNMQNEKLKAENIRLENCSIKNELAAMKLKEQYRTMIEQLKKNGLSAVYNIQGIDDLKKALDSVVTTGQKEGSDAIRVVVNLEGGVYISHFKQE